MVYHNLAMVILKLEFGILVRMKLLKVQLSRVSVVLASPPKGISDTKYDYPTEEILLTRRMTFSSIRHRINFFQLVVTSSETDSDLGEERCHCIIASVTTCSLSCQRTPSAGMSQNPANY